MGLRMAKTGVEKFSVRNMLPTMVQGLGFSGQDVLRVYALYTDTTLEAHAQCQIS